MAQRVTTSLVDDLDGSEADETVSFGLDGVDYEADLSDDNATALRNALSDYVEAARRTGGRKQQGRRPSSGAGRATVDREQSKAVRDWGRKQGWSVSDRGRIPGDLYEAWEKAHVGAAA